MSYIFVLDACSIINILRIDTSEEFLTKWLSKENVKIPDIVIREVKDNYKKNNIDDDILDRVEKQINQLYACQVSKNDIDSYDENKMMDELISFSKHQKKLNGELYCTALSLIECKENDEDVLFITDDYPAQKEFEDYFTLHQIGHIADTVDLLLLIYHHSVEDVFTRNQLIMFLTLLKQRYAEKYNTLLKDCKDFADQLYNRRNKNDKQLGYKLSTIIEEFYKNPAESIENLCNIFLNIKNDNIKKLKYQLEHINEPPQIVNKIMRIEFALSNYKIYKIAQ